MAKFQDLGNNKSNELAKKVVAFIEANVPIKVPNKNRVFNITDIEVLDNPARSNSSAQLQMRSLSQEDYRAGKGDLFGKVTGTVTITENGKTVDILKNMEIIPIPLLTNRGTYIVDGNEKSIMNQMRAKPGVYTENKRQSDVQTNFMLNAKESAKGTPKISVIINSEKNTFKFSVGKGAGYSKQVSGVSFLQALGFSMSEIQAALGKMAPSLTAKYTQKSPRDVFKEVVGRYPKSSSPESIAKELNDYLTGSCSFGKNGAETVEFNLGLKNITALDKNVILEAVKKTANVASGTVAPDDSQSLVYKEILNDVDFLYESLTRELTSFFARSKATLERTSYRKNVKEKGPQLMNIGGMGSLGYGTKKFLKVDSLSATVDQVNPLANAATPREITQLGAHGGLSKKSAIGALENRNLNLSQFGRLDPVETPESGKIGFQSHLAQNAKIKNKNITTVYLKVNNGVAIDSAPNRVELSPYDEKNKTIAFYDSRFLTRAGNKITFKKGNVPARINGIEQDVPSSRVEYVDIAPQSLFGEVSNMIPFVNHDDGNRVLMGANMQKQALDLVQKEVPLVSSAVRPNSKVTYEEKLGKELGRPVYAKIDGMVTSITNDAILIGGKSGRALPHPYYKYFPLNHGGFVNNKLLVQVGSRVKKGQMIAEGWQTVDGKLSIGTNLRIGYMSYDGYNFEDGIVISEATAKKMRTQEVFNNEILIPEGCVGGRGSDVIKFLAKGTILLESVPSYIDQDGLIKEGTDLKPGMIAAIWAEPLADADHTNEFFKTIVQNEWKAHKVTIPNTSYLKGTVQRVTSVENPGNGLKTKIIYTMSTENNLKIGDKLAGRHGNKGTITKILPDKEMPIAEDGKKLDILYSPLSIPSRKNVGQLLEANAGLIAEKTGKQFVVNNFDHREHERVLQGLKQIGIPDGKMSVSMFRDGKAVPVEDRITVGNAYIMKLNHKADEKIQARSNSETAPSFKSNMPSKAIGRAAGEKGNPQALGNMEVMGLQAHGAVWNLLESSTIKADGGGDVKMRMAIFNALKNKGDNFDSLTGDATPETLKVYSDYLQGLGLKISPYNGGRKVGLNETFSSVGLSFMKPDEILQKIGKENKINNEIPIAISTGRKTKKSDNRDQLMWKSKAHSLKDPAIFGDGKTSEDRTKWGYIELNAPLPIPILANQPANPYTLLTGMSEKEFKGLMDAKFILVVDPDRSPNYDTIFGKDAAQAKVRAKMIMARHKITPGTVYPTKTIKDLIAKEDVYIPWKVSGDAVHHMLRNINVDEEFKNTAAQLKEPQKSITTLDRLYKKEKILMGLKKENKQPADLMMRYVPVLPLHLRPLSDDVKTQTGGVDDLNYLYQNLIRTNNKSSKINAFVKDPSLTPGMTPEVAAKQMGANWRSLSNLMIKSEAKRAHVGSDLKSITDKLSGKKGFVQGEMLSKRQDFSGRGVIGVDPTLALDECKLPYDMARKLFEPMVMKELRDSGKAIDDFESTRLLDAKEDSAIFALKKVMLDRPVILNRQPTLHKYGMLAFKPTLDLDGSVGDIDSPARNIKINPLVVTPFNADFDGDQMAVHVPLTKRSIAEAKALLYPSSNIINTNTGRINFPLKGEMIAGLYEMTTKKSRTPDQGISVKYPGTQDGWVRLKNDYLAGKDGMRITTKVDLPPFIGVSVGAALFDFCIPPQYRSKYAGITANSSVIEKLQEDYIKDAAKFGYKRTGYTEKDVAAFYDKLKTLGLECSTRIGASAISIQDFNKTIDTKTMNMIKRTSIAEVKKEQQDAAKSSGTKFKWQLTPQTKIEIEGKTQEKIEGIIKSPDSFLGQDNALYKMMTSKAKGNADQVRRMTVMVGAGIDVTGKRLAPVLHSNFEGMSPNEYFRHSKDSRKGMYDRSVGTAKPGEMTKIIGRTMQGQQITESDCRTMDGIMMAKASGSIEGRVLAEDVKSKASGTEAVIAKRNDIVTPELAKILNADETVNLMLKIRSPLRCTTHNGICQQCYGCKPGMRTLVPMGDPIGINATHAFGEPITQMTMKTFHQGGTSTKVTQGIPALRKVLGLRLDGETEPATFSRGRNLKYMPKNPIQDREQTQQRMVSGLATLVGDSLKSKENLGPRYKGVATPIKVTPALDSRHIETIVGKLTSYVKIIDAGDSKFSNGSVQQASDVDQWNKANPQKKPAKYVNDYQTVSTGYRAGNESWMHHAAAMDLRRNLGSAAALGYVDQLDAPTTRFMTGKLQRFGPGWDIYNKATNYANGIATNMGEIFKATPTAVEKKVSGTSSKGPLELIGNLFSKKKKKK